MTTVRPWAFTRRSRRTYWRHSRSATAVTEHELTIHTSAVAGSAAENGHHVWAERYDRELEDIFELQDTLTERIAATVAPEIERAMRKGSLATKRLDLDAWDRFQRGMAHQDEYTRDGIERAREMFMRAIEIDPGFSQAYAALAFTYFNENLLGYSRSMEENRTLGLEHAKKAVDLDNTDPMARFVLEAKGSASHLGLCGLD